MRSEGANAAAAPQGAAAMSVAAGVLLMLAVLFVRPAQAARLALGAPAPEVKTESDLRAFLDDLEAQELLVYESLSLEEYYQWKGLAPHQVGAFSRFNQDIHNRRDYADIIEAWHGKVADSTLARRLDIHHRDFRQSRADPALTLALSDVQTAVQDSVENFRFRLNGARLTLTPLTESIRTSPNRAMRRAAFLARPQIARVNRPGILRAMHLNDSIMRGEGFANGAEGGLALASLTREQVFHDLDAFEKATRPTYVQMLEHVKRDLHVDRVEPWDIDYWLHVQEQSVGDAYPREPGLTRLMDLSRALGFAADSLPIDVKVWDVPTGGITFPIRPPFESRLLTNPFSGSDFYETLFHEYGHCLNAVLTRADLAPIFLQGDETPLSEGLAETLGHFAYDRYWLARAAGLSFEKAASLERIGKLQLLVWLRRSISLNAWVEINAYDNLDADLDKLERESYRRFVGVDLPPGDYFASRDEFATGQLYLQSYLYANMIATQLREAMRLQFAVPDLSNEPRVAGWLTQYFYAPGGSIPWQEKIRRATGRPLSTDPLVAYLAITWQ